MRSHSAQALNKPKRISSRSLLGIAGVMALLGNCSSGEKVTVPDIPAPSIASVTILGAPATGTMMVGDRVTLTALARNETGAAVSATMVWSSSNPAAITVANGELQAIGTGEATITATAGARSATLDIISREPLRAPGAGETQSVTTTTFGGAVSMTIPPAAVPAGIALAVTPAAAGAAPASENLLAGTAFTFFPSGAQFASPLTLSLRFSGAGLTAAERAGLGLYLATATGWQRIPGSGPVAGSDFVTGSVSHFSTYAVLKRPMPASVSVVAGAGQTGEAGEALSVAPVVRVLDSRGMPLEGAAVAFAVTAGGGSLTSLTATTNADGRASPGTWTLGSAGTNSISATVEGLTALTITATAVVTPPPIVLSATSVAISWIRGSADPDSRTITVTTTAGKTLNDVTVSAPTYVAGSAGWLTISRSGNSSPSLLTLGVLTNALAVGSYTAEFTVSASNPGVAPQRVTVTLNVTPPPAPASFTVTLPTSVLSGIALSPAPSVSLRLPDGSPALGASVNVSVSVVTPGMSLVGTTTRSSAGLASVSFPGLAITGVGVAQLRFSVSGISAPISEVTLVQDWPSNLTITSGATAYAWPSFFPSNPITAVRLTSTTGAPWPNAMVDIAPVTPGTGTAFFLNTDTNGDGAFGFSPTVTGTVGVRASVRNYPTSPVMFTLLVPSARIEPSQIFAAALMANPPADGTTIFDVLIGVTDLSADCVHWVSASITGTAVLGPVVKQPGPCGYRVSVRAPNTPQVATLSVTVDGQLGSIPVTINFRQP